MSHRRSRTKSSKTSRRSARSNPPISAPAPTSARGLAFTSLHLLKLLAAIVLVFAPSRAFAAGASSFDAPSPLEVVRSHLGDPGPITNPLAASLAAISVYAFRSRKRATLRDGSTE